MNKRGSTLFIMLSLGTLFFFLGLALAPALNEAIQESRNTVELNCSNTTISNQDRAVCTQIDMFTPLFTGVIFGLAGILLGRVAF